MTRCKNSVAYGYRGTLASVNTYTATRNQSLVANEVTIVYRDCDDQSIAK